MNIFEPPSYLESTHYQPGFKKRSRSITSFGWIFIAIFVAIMAIANPTVLSLSFMVGTLAATLTFYIVGSSLYRNDQDVVTPYRSYEVVPMPLITVTLFIFLLGMGLSYIAVNTVAAKVPSGISKEELSEIYIDHYIRSIRRNNPDYGIILASEKATEDGLKAAIALTSKEAFEVLFDDLWQHYSTRERNRNSYIVSLYRDSVVLNEVDIRKGIFDGYLQVRLIANSQGFGGPIRTNIRRNERGAAEFYAAVDNLLANVFKAPPMPREWEVNNKAYFEQHLHQHFQLPEKLTGTFIYHLERYTEGKDYQLEKLYDDKKEDFEGRVAPIRRDFSDEQIISHPVLTFLRYHRYIDERFHPLMIPPKGNIDIVPMGLSEDDFRLATFNNYTANQFEQHIANAKNRFVVNDIVRQNWISESRILYVALVALMLMVILCIPVFFYKQHSHALHSEKETA